MSEPDYIRAHVASIYNQKQVEESISCGCFDCLAIFSPKEITEWTDESHSTGATAMCPYCYNDTVIGSALGFSITKEFLEKMKQHWCPESID
ncbi:MAG TPA: cytoplasmic protein [Pyrinomonadaceae bacterium]|nr:cytoplasmic protein [Pyrinomonadaceae bacterium]